MEPVSISELLSVEELAQLLKVPKSWIYDHARKKGKDRLPHLKLGKYLRFSEAEIGQWLIARARGN